MTDGMNRVRGADVRLRGPVAALAVAVYLLLANATSVGAHEKGVITLSTKQAAVGTELVINGRKMSKGASFRIELRGALRTFNFGRVPANDSGAFVMRVTLPADAAPGQYTVAAVAADGDVSAQADLVISAAVATQDMRHPEMHNMPAMAGMKGMEGTNGPHATAEPMEVDVATSAGEWATIALIVIPSAIGGLLMLRHARKAPPPRTPDTKPSPASFS